MTISAQTPRLDAGDIAHAAERLRARIEERLPEPTLADLAQSFTAMVPEVAGKLSESRGRLGRTRVLARLAAGVVVLLSVVAFWLALKDPLLHGTQRSSDWVPLVESTINDLVFAAVAVFFLWALPERTERRALLRELHKLRTLAHVVDMHQLDKDPEQARDDYHPTAVSPPRRIMDAEELHHYLDYCSELVALIAKTAALCAERTSDPVVLGTVSEIETVTAHMSQKIWQKISLLSED